MDETSLPGRRLAEPADLGDVLVATASSVVESAAASVALHVLTFADGTRIGLTWDQSTVDAYNGHSGELEAGLELVRSAPPEDVARSTVPYSGVDGSEMPVFGAVLPPELLEASRDDDPELELDSDEPVEPVAGAPTCVTCGHWLLGDGTCPQGCDQPDVAP